MFPSPVSCDIIDQWVPFVAFCRFSDKFGVRLCFAEPITESYGCVIGIGIPLYLLRNTKQRDGNADRRFSIAPPDKADRESVWAVLLAEPANRKASKKASKAG